MQKKSNILMRGSVARFAEAMEAELRNNDHKPGWDQDTLYSLINRIGDELRELRNAYRKRPHGRLRLAKIRKECSDVANFAMMVFDNAGRLLDSCEEENAEEIT